VSIRSLRLLAVCLGVTCAFFLLAPAARAADVGDLAPEFEGKEFLNCEDMSLRTLRGRLVLFELFSTG